MATCNSCNISASDLLDIYAWSHWGYISVGLWINYEIYCHGDQLSSFSQLIGGSCDHHFVHLFGKSLSLLSKSEEISNYRSLKRVVNKAL